MTGSMAISKDEDNCILGVVAQHTLKHFAEQTKGGGVTVAEGICSLPRTGLREAGIPLGQVHWRDVGRAAELPYRHQCPAEVGPELAAVTA